MAGDISTEYFIKVHTPCKTQDMYAYRPAEDFVRIYESNFIAVFFYTAANDGFFSQVETFVLMFEQWPRLKPEAMQ